MECIDCRDIFVPTTAFSTPLVASKSLKVPPFSNTDNTDGEGTLITATCPATNTSAVAKGCELVLFNVSDESDELQPLELEFEANITALCWDSKGMFVRMYVCMYV